MILAVARRRVLDCASHRRAAATTRREHSHQPRRTSATHLCQLQVWEESGSRPQPLTTTTDGVSPASPLTRT